MSIDTALKIIETSLIGDFVDNKTKKCINDVFSFYDNKDIYSDDKIYYICDVLDDYNSFLYKITGHDSAAIETIMFDMEDYVDGWRSAE